MKHYIDYDTDGRLVAGYGGFTPAGPPGAGITRMEVQYRADADTQYVLAGDVEFRPTNPATADKYTFTCDEVDKVTMTNIPNPSDVSITGPGTSVMVTVTDGVLEVSAAAPGQYLATIESFPELEITMDLRAEV